MHRADRIAWRPVHRIIMFIREKGDGWFTPITTYLPSLEPWKQSEISAIHNSASNMHSSCWNPNWVHSTLKAFRTSYAIMAIPRTQFVNTKIQQLLHIT